MLQHDMSLIFQRQNRHDMSLIFQWQNRLIYDELNYVREAWTQEHIQLMQSWLMHKEDYMRQ